jgi:homoserine kinase type II
MSVYTTVTDDELSAWLRHYRVGTLVELRGIAAGIENTNYFVTTTSGRYVLTLFEKLSATELPFYLNLMAFLADHGVPSAHPVANDTGALLGELKGKPAALVAFLPGRDVADPAAAHCSAVGTVLARIHVAGRSYPDRMTNPRGLSWWQQVDPEIVPFMGQEEAGLLRREIAFQAEHAFDDVPHGAIHADLFRDNVLFHDGRISGVIDFYFACTDALLYDVAITVNDWCVQADGSLDAPRTTALLGAYQATRPIGEREAETWPVMLRAAALRFWISRLYDLHLPRPGELTHAKDPAHFERILRRHVERPQHFAGVRP